jgi:hypothetical protein
VLDDNEKDYIISYLAIGQSYTFLFLDKIDPLLNDEDEIVLQG